MPKPYTHPDSKWTFDHNQPLFKLGFFCGRCGEDASFTNEGRRLDWVREHEQECSPVDVGGCRLCGETWEYVSTAEARRYEGQHECDEEGVVVPYRDYPETAEEAFDRVPERQPYLDPDFSGEQIVENEDTGGKKGRKPQRMDLLPWDMLLELAEHYAKGADKYDDHNWRKGYEWSLSKAAAQRHLAQFWMGEDFDPEFGTKHVLAAAFHCLTLAYFMDAHPELDDRPSTQTEQSFEEAVEQAAERLRNEGLV